MKTAILLKACPITPKMLKDVDIRECRAEDWSLVRFPKNEFDKTFFEFLKSPSDQTIFDTLSNFDNVQRYNLRYVDVADSIDRIVEVIYGHYSYMYSPESEFLRYKKTVENRLEKWTQRSRFNPIRWIVLWHIEPELKLLNAYKIFYRVYNTYTREWWLDIYHD